MVGEDKSLWSFDSEGGDDLGDCFFVNRNRGSFLFSESDLVIF